jgi:hypothetical protein
MTSTSLNDSVIPFYINSADRNDINSRSTDFTINLRKSLRNIVSLSASKVVIPDAVQTINNNNNTLVLQINNDGFLTELAISIPNGNYTEVDIASTIEGLLNSSIVTLSFGITWAVSYNVVNRVIEFTVLYPLGPSRTSWGINFEYTPFIDLIGMGNGETVTQEYTTSLTDTLQINGSRSLSLTGPLWYNITSETLTANINTSYINSLGKNFDINNSNNLIAFNVTQNQEGASLQIPFGTGASLFDTFFGHQIKMSDDGNIIIASTYVGTVHTFIRLDSSSPWEQRNIIAGYNSTIPSIALSGDGGFMAIGDYSSNVNTGQTLIYSRAGFDWIYKTTLIGSNSEGPFTRQGRGLALNYNGDTLAIAGPEDGPNFRGSVWIFTRNGDNWTEEAGPIYPSDVAVGSYSTLFGDYMALSNDGNTLVAGAYEDDNSGVSGNGVGATWVFVRVAGVWSQQGLKLIGTGASNPSNQGIAVAVSSDGDTLAVGGNKDNASAGAVWIFTRTAGVWSQQGAKLVGTGGTGTDRQGQGLDLSADGNSLIIGGPGYNGANGGAQWYFTRTAGVWSQQGTLFNGVGPTIDTDQGQSIALSADGKILASGGSRSDERAGAVWTFELTGTWNELDTRKLPQNISGPSEQGTSIAVNSDFTRMAVGLPKDLPLRVGGVITYKREPGQTRWIQTGSVLNGTGLTGPNISEGQSVAMDSAGNTLIVGAYEDNGQIGACVIYTRTDDTWTQQGSILVGTGNTGQSNQGWSVAISGDGNTVAIGSRRDDSYTGAVWIFTRTAGVWSQQGSKLVGIDTTAGAFIGYSIDISFDGNTIAVGAPKDNTNVGAVVIFTRSAGVWSQQGPKLVGTGYVTGFAGILDYHQGNSVSISDDGNTVVFGSGSDGTNRHGAVWVFTRTLGIWNQQGGKLTASDYLSNHRVGTSISLSSDGNTFVTGAPFKDTNKGSFLVWERDNGIWSQVSDYITIPYSGSQTASQGQVVKISDDATSIFVGGPDYQSGIGTVWWYIRSGEYTDILTATLTKKSYAIVDLINEMKLKFVFPDVSFDVSFDVKTNTVILSSVGAITNPVFTVNNDLTSFDIIRWLSTIPALTQSSDGKTNFNLNNNILKTIVDRSGKSSGLITDDTESIVFRKYEPGFTVKDTDSIDIQLRDERDRIIDLNNANWVMIIYATVHL